MQQHAETTQPAEISRLRRGAVQPGAEQQQPISMRPRDAARMLGISEASLWRWSATRKDFPAKRVIGPRTTVWDYGELLAFRDAHSTAKRD